MNQYMTHANNIAPSYLRVLCLQLFGDEVGGLTNNLDILHHSEEQHLVILQVIHRSARKELRHIIDCCQHVLQSSGISNKLSHI